MDGCAGAVRKFDFLAGIPELIGAVATGDGVVGSVAVGEAGHVAHDE